MMNGDNLIPIHNDVITANFLLGNLYVYFYVFMSIVYAIVYSSSL
jgi:hypothetical protein